MDRRRALLGTVLASATFLLVGTTVAVVETDVVLTPREELGKAIFFDENLSINANQSCATCHAPEAGWTGPHAAINGAGGVYEGSVPGAFGNRKPPSSAYATFAPVLSVNKKGLFVGGNFWDGRATGWRLGSPAAEQAQGPFLNPMEQALPSPSDVVSLVCAASYAPRFLEVCGADACDPGNVQASYDCIGYAIAAYEGSAESNAFTSRFDYALKRQANLTQQEQLGRALFNGKGKCARCHPLKGQKPLFTDFTYDNLGLPKNPVNPFYGSHPDFVDLGLGGFLASFPPTDPYAGYARANMGKHKVPTLRNVDRWDAVLGPKVKAYGHNAYFKSLEGIVHFYNTRDVKPACPGAYTEAEALAASCWPIPEVGLNLNTSELGDLGLSAEEEAAIVAFLKTLSDGYVP